MTSLNKIASIIKMITIIFEVKELIKTKIFVRISNVVNSTSITMIFIIIKTNVINEVNVENIIIVINKTIANVVINLLKIRLIQLFRCLYLE